MKNQQKSKERKLAENIDDFFENGPRLSYKRNTWILAKSHDGRFVYNGGLGGLGIGEMWCVADETDRDDPEWAIAPTHRYVPNPTDVGHVFKLGPKVAE